MEEFRWILLGLGILLIAGIAWWGARRSRRSPGNAELREPGTRVVTPITGSVRMGQTGPGDDEGPSGHEHPFEGSRGAEESRDWGVPPFEPLSIRTTDFDEVQMVDVPMSATAEPPDVTLNMDTAEQEVATAPQEPDASPAAAAPATPAPATSPAPITGEAQRIVTVRVSAVGDMHWAGSDLMALLQAQGLEHGRYKVFHRRHTDGRTLFCAASLVEPGTFDLTRMPREEYRGLTLFAVLPGPADALETVDVMIGTAVELADALQGVVQDANGAPLSAQRAEALREDVARFQASLNPP